MVNLNKIKITLNSCGYLGTARIGLDYLRLWNLPEIVKIKPKLVQIEVSNRCNLRCSMCYINDLKREQMGDLSFEKFKEIIDKNFNYPHSIRLWGFGEPLLNKDLFKMIKYERKKGNFVTTSTNGILLDEEMCDKIIDSGLNMMMISIDGSNKETYEKIRIGGKFETLLKNMETLSKKIKEKGKGPLVDVTTTAMQDNIHELPDLAKLLSRYNIKNLRIQEVQLSHPGIILEDKQSIYNSTKAKEILNKTIKVGKKHNINVIIPKIKLRTKRENCVSPWMQVYITYEGYVTPCCRNQLPSHYVCGNIFEESFDNIWNNEKYKKFRKNLRENILLPKCKNCTML